MNQATYSYAHSSTSSDSQDIAAEGCNGLPVYTQIIKRRIRNDDTDGWLPETAVLISKNGGVKTISKHAYWPVNKWFDKNTTYTPEHSIM